MIKPEWIPDSNSFLTHEEVVARPECERLEEGFGRVDLEHCQILVRVIPHQVRLERTHTIFLYISDRNSRGLSISDDVKVGNNVPFQIPDEAAARTRWDFDGVHCVLVDRINLLYECVDKHHRRCRLLENLNLAHLAALQHLPGFRRQRTPQPTACHSSKSEHQALPKVPSSRLLDSTAMRPRLRPKPRRDTRTMPPPQRRSGGGRYPRPKVATTRGSRGSQSPGFGRAC
mmetsp:Transcript_17928/g.32081  ORF Transcript_17928/g.32081 Transcript_17928/m.32081 type:complete len:230 (-) Transcript_17928:81-770(-)